jgi:hypothetical protein
VDELPEAGEGVGWFCGCHLAAWQLGMVGIYRACGGVSRRWRILKRSREKRRERLRLARLFSQPLRGWAKLCRSYGAEDRCTDRVAGWMGKAKRRSNSKTLAGGDSFLRTKLVTQRGNGARQRQTSKSLRSEDLSYIAAPVELTAFQRKSKEPAGRRRDGMAAAQK